MKSRTAITVLIAGLLLVGCQHKDLVGRGYPGFTPVAKGATMGAVTGGAIGGVTSGAVGIPVGAAIGGVAGGVVGSYFKPATPSERMTAAGVKVIVVGETVRIILPTDNFFGPGSFGLKASYARVMQDVVDYVNLYHSNGIVVNGYTNKTDKPKRDKALSLQRAQEVVDYLVDHGVKAPFIYAQGFGGTNPVASSMTSLGRAANRRVEITFMANVKDNE